MRSILIIEDEIIVAKGIEQILLKNGYDISGIALNYKQAKEKIQNSTPDVILCDIDLNEDKTGIDIIEESVQKDRIPVIFVSAHTDDEILNKAFCSNPVTYITKPFTENQLLTAVKFAITDRLQGSLTIFKKLTKTEKEIVRLLANSMTTMEIAEYKHRSYETINNHKRNIYQKLNINKLSDLITLAIENGLK